MSAIEITRQTIHQGTEALAIIRHDHLYYVTHVDARSCMRLVGGETPRYATYAEAHDRLVHEVWQRQRT